MKTLLKSLFLLLLASTGVSAAQDPEVRCEALELMERASAASLPAKLPNLERVDTFRVLDAGSGPREGTFTRVVVQGTGRREEASFGDYHLAEVSTGGNLATMKSQGCSRGSGNGHWHHADPPDALRWRRRDSPHRHESCGRQERAVRRIRHHQRTKNRE